jgi:hypothetical protein
MLENEFEKRLAGICNAAHWRVFVELLREPSLWDPLRAAVEALVNAAVATNNGTGGPGHEVTIDSTAAGPSIFSHMAADWEANYNRWQADLHHRRPDVPGDVEVRQVEGMGIWYTLAELRPEERWLAPPFRKPPRVYKLLEVLRPATA